MCVALLLAIVLPAAADEPTYDGYQELLDYEARLAMDKGDFKRAESLFWRLVQINPDFDPIIATHPTLRPIP